MTPRQITYYNWFDDIQPELCRNIGITEDEISEYVNGEYRNYWHVWLKIFAEDVQNDTFNKMYFPEDNNYNYYKATLQKLIDTGQYGPWAFDLIDSVQKMVNDHNLQGEVIIYFSW